MKVVDFINQLKNLPPDYSVELSKVISVENEDGFEVRLDFPIIGIAVNDDNKECCLVVEHDKTVAHFGNSIKKLE